MRKSTDEDTFTDGYILITSDGASWKRNDIVRDMLRGNELDKSSLNDDASAISISFTYPDEE